MSLRNVAIIAHVDHGKTTLVDQLLVQSGAVNGKPSVDSGTSICDFDEEEKHHKHSIESSVVHLDHAGKRINIIDCPLSALDGEGDRVAGIVAVSMTRPAAPLRLTISIDPLGGFGSHVARAPVPAFGKHRQDGLNRHIDCHGASG